MTTLPTLIGLLTLSVLWVVVTPDPLSGTFRFELEASEVTEILPSKLPVDGAVNVTLNDALCPGASVIGADIPEILKPVPLAEI